ncbi:sensor domain-containing protein [Planococcus sp. YIM B11945]|uniref:sensor domain-containing protein n=1 Tax=Planococcus sp. YIM B11945 TaxID=3435410 RepID=UPI003D7E1D81
MGKEHAKSNSLTSTMNTAILQGEAEAKNFLYYKEMFETLIQNAPVSMYVLEDWVYKFVNSHFTELIGYTEEEIIKGKITVEQIIHPDDLPLVHESVKRRMGGKEKNARYRARAFKKNGELLYVEVHATKSVVDGKIILFGTVFDVTDEVTAKMRLEENQERFHSLFYNNPDAVFSFDLKGMFIDNNKACELLTGYTEEELFAMSFAPLIVSEDLAIALQNFEEAIKGGTRTYEVTITRKDEARRRISVTNFPMYLAGEIIGAYGIAKDITEKIEHQKQMEDLIFYDMLTKLPNRKLFEDRLEQVLKFSNETEHQPVVLFLDLDRFKFINDSLGHHLGDEFLKLVSLRLKELVGKAATVGRFAGDEFAILLPHAEKEKAIQLAEQLNQTLSAPFDIEGHSVSASASIGVAFSEGSGETVEGLIKKADIAMYYTKKYGKNNYTVYSEELELTNENKLTLEKGLKSAISNEEFILHYQPIVDLKTGEIKAMEALIRWNHPELGLVPPDNFIPISEESGQIVSIGKWVLQTACSQNKKWQDHGFPPFKICVNISTIQLQHPNFVKVVQSVLEETGLESRWLELEVTESILMEDTKILKESLINLKALGISMSIDDFGTGYTSLSYLRQFSFDRVKIDRSFVSDINSDSNGKAITSTIIALAHKLNMGVIAEGIEDETQLAYLIGEECDEGQGYYFNRPLPANLHELTLETKKYW